MLNRRDILKGIVATSAVVAIPVAAAVLTPSDPLLDAVSKDKPELDDILIIRDAYLKTRDGSDRKTLRLISKWAVDKGECLFDPRFGWDKVNRVIRELEMK